MVRRFVINGCVSSEPTPSTTTGDIVYLNVLGKPIVVLGSYKVACDLLDKRSSNYSGRPKSVMASL